ncbi:DAK2 domain-containing protein [Herbidospora sp. NEAU-GS84]|uniref:DAK2 domain-containing protein n=1 Tax=Herbidospora solisilvae TaxID=2696284 RepID=A0A7C9N4Z4_9ACTN|nr:DAK2 domain-containing protein [Herbidospora solisilvae]NAS24714.1 DAK2 domain-containing protein [Herbidospora solisilvae]
MLDVLDPPAVREWARRSAQALGAARAQIDALNVYPVPDGDTGTNLHLTLLAAADALDALPDTADHDATWRALAHGALLGARGNSGVIVSQALRGLAEVLRTAEGRAADLRTGLVRAAELATAAVSRPVEGTVLSVLATAASAVRDLPGDLAAIAAKAAEEARKALARTTVQLDVLARNGVVDAGAAGLVIILETLVDVVTGVHGRHEVPAPTRPVLREDDEDVHGYEVMYLLEAPSVDRLREQLDALGDSLVIVGGDGLWNVHVHVADAGAAIEAGLAAGRPYRIRITYLGGRPHVGGGRGVVAVAAGDGLAALFRESGAVVVTREPGSSPPLAAVLAAIREAGSEVAVLPNDAAVRSVAAAAAEIAREEGTVVGVLPTLASVQGLAALAVHDPARRFDDDVLAMAEAAAHTRHGHVWVANREAMTSAGVCRPGDVLGVVDGDVALIGADLREVTEDVVRRLVSASSELVTLVTGGETGEGLAKAVQDLLAVERPDVEVVVHAGGQGGYPLLIGVE